MRLTPSRQMAEGAREESLSPHMKPCVIHAAPAFYRLALCTYTRHVSLSIPSMPSRHTILIHIHIMHIAVYVWTERSYTLSSISHKIPAEHHHTGIHTHRK